MIRRLLMLSVLAAALAACSVDLPSAPPTADAGATSPPASSEPAPAETDPPATESPDHATTDPVTPPPTDPPATEPPTDEPDPDGTVVPGSADACTGTDENREFYESVAGAVDWTVICPVLPKGWFVDTGQYRLAGGGRLTISYKGPDGARLSLSEGAFCADQDGCVPAGSDAGEAALGPLSGTLVELDDGGWAVVVDRGASISWLLVTKGLDEAASSSLAADLHVVGG